MDKLTSKEHDIKQYSTLALAYIGDSVYELMVREHLLQKGNKQPAKLHEDVIKKVNASAQAKAVKKIEPYFTETEEEIFKRGKNATPKHIPKSADKKNYQKATGLETLWGYLYLTGNLDRLNKLFIIIFEENITEEK